MFAAGVLYSTAGLFTHAVHLDVWTILAWRAVFGVLFLLAWMAVEKRGRLLRAFILSPRDLALTLPAALGGYCYILALKLTTVADVMVIYATMPFVTMAVAWVWTREVPNRRIVVAGTAALVGVAVMVAGGAAGGSRLAGIGMTLLMNVSFAITLVTSRESPGSTTTIFTTGTALCGALAFALSPHPAVASETLAVLAAFGVLTIGLAMALYMTGARMIPPAEVGLVGIVDVVIGPVLVWWMFGENPGRSTVAGGVIVILALLWHLLPDLKRLLGSPLVAESVSERDTPHGAARSSAYDGGHATCVARRLARPSVTDDVSGEGPHCG